MFNSFSNVSLFEALSMCIFKLFEYLRAEVKKVLGDPVGKNILYLVLQPMSTITLLFPDRPTHCFERDTKTGFLIIQHSKFN